MVSLESSEISATCGTAIGVGRGQLVQVYLAGPVLARWLLAQYDAITRQHDDRSTPLPLADEERS